MSVALDPPEVADLIKHRERFRILEGERKGVKEKGREGRREGGREKGREEGREGGMEGGREDKREGGSEGGREGKRDIPRKVEGGKDS